MSNWFEPFIEMVNLLLNIIHFQRIGNWQSSPRNLPWQSTIADVIADYILTTFLLHWQKNCNGVFLALVEGKV